MFQWIPNSLTEHHLLLDLPNIDIRNVSRKLLKKNLKKCLNALNNSSIGSNEITGRNVLTDKVIGPENWKLLN